MTIRMGTGDSRSRTARNKFSCYYSEIVQKHPSRLLIKLVKGNPSEEFKAMLGVYKIIEHKEWQSNSQGYGTTTVPVFIHSTKKDQRLIFSTDKNCWKFEKNLETVFTWPRAKTVFNDESWLKPNGSAILNFGSLKFTFHMIPY